jgi:carboxymethylenebutenolidase
VLAADLSSRAEAITEATMERAIQIAMGDGTAGGFLYTEGTQPRRGVLYLTDIGGVRRAVREAAARLASEGFTVLLPNIFFRVGEPPFFTPPLNMSDPAVRAKFGQLFGSLPPPTMEQDGGRYVDFLGSQPEVADLPVAVVGHCMTGAMALRTAAACPDRVSAAASFHGGRLCTDAADSPHLVLPRVKARLYFGHAVKDGSMPQEAIDKLGHALADWGGRHESEVYEGALHGWTSKDSAIYNEVQAERAFAKLLELLR